MKESEIRDRQKHARYLQLVKEDSETFFSDKTNFQSHPCPGCGNEGRSERLFEKEGFCYAQCSGCATIYCDPRPPISDLAKLYGASASTKYWVEEFFGPFIEVRREKIFKPRAEYIASRFPEFRGSVVGDIGAGFGLFLEELRKYWPVAKLRAIEPSDDMARICESKGIQVLKAMLEDVDSQVHSFDLLTSFELVEHLHDPEEFFRKIHALLKPGGVFYFATLNGLGFDIQVLWDQSRSIAPPHHLNFLNPSSIATLMERTGFDVLEVTTPGKLDWDIVENAAKDGAAPAGRFFEVVRRFGSESAKAEFQGWIARNNFSSHMRGIGRKR